MNSNCNIALGLTLIAGTSMVVNGYAAEKKRPNIVMLFVDDLGWADVGYRNPKFLTPNIDQLKGESMCFNRAYVGQPASSPSRASLLTGKNPVRFQMVRHIDNKDMIHEDAHHEEFSMYPDDPAEMPSRNWLPLEEVTFAERLKECGYYNMFIGKWHLGPEEYWPEKQGYDASVGVSDFGNVSSYYAPFFKFKSGSNMMKNVENGTFITDYLTSNAVSFIENYDKDQPFLLSFSYYNVHTPNKGRLDLVQKYMAKGMSEVDANYAAQVTAVDESVGTIRKALADKGIADNTIVIFFSDQGGFFSNYPLRGCKKIEDTLAEGGIRVPLTILYPGVTQAGTETDVPVQAIDFYPTFVEIASGKPCKDKWVNGVSILPLLKGKSIKERSLYVFRSYIDQYAALVHGDWKLIKWHTGKYQFYNLKYDESETTDLQHVEPKIFEQLKQDLRDWETEAVPSYENDYRKRFKY